MENTTILIIVIVFIVLLLLILICSSVVASVNNADDIIDGTSNYFIIPANSLITTIPTSSCPFSGYYLVNDVSTQYIGTVLPDNECTYTSIGSTTLRFSQLVSYTKDSNNLITVVLDVDSNNYCFATLSADSNIICKNNNIIVPSISGFLGQFAVNMNYSSTDYITTYMTTGSLTITFQSS